MRCFLRYSWEFGFVPYRFCLRKSSIFLQASSTAWECATVSPPHKAITVETVGNRAWSWGSDFWHLNPDSVRFLSEGKPTFLACINCFEDAGSGVWCIRWFNQVTSVWIWQDGQQVAVPSLLHHFFHLEKKQMLQYYNTSSWTSCYGCRLACRDEWSV